MESAGGSRPRVVRGGRGSGSSGVSYDPHGLRDVRDLPSLAGLVERHVRTWAEERNVVVLQAAFNKAGEVGCKPRADSELRRRVMRQLAEAYLPLVSGRRSAKACVIPLWACAKLDYWEGGLATGLLKRMKIASLLKTTEVQNMAKLWWSVSAAPAEVVAAATPVLEESTSCLLAMPARDLDPRHCSNILLACGRLKRNAPALLHHLTACIAARTDANGQDLANTLYSLGKLAEDCGHQPRPEDLQRLADQVVTRLGQGARGGGRGASKETFAPQAIANILLGCSKLDYGNPALLRSLGASAGRAASRMASQDVAKSLHALAKLGCSEGVYTPAVRRLCLEARERLQLAPSSFLPHNLSNMLWALAVLRPSGCEGLAGALAAECRQRGLDGLQMRAANNGS